VCSGLWGVENRVPVGAARRWIAAACQVLCLLLIPPFFGSTWCCAGGQRTRRRRPRGGRRRRRVPVVGRQWGWCWSHPFSVFV
jgi:hypothetical protein